MIHFCIFFIAKFYHFLFMKMYFFMIHPAVKHIEFHTIKCDHILVQWSHPHSSQKTCRLVFDLTVCQSSLFTTGFAFGVGKDEQLIHNPQQAVIYWNRQTFSHTTNNDQWTLSPWDTFFTVILFSQRSCECLPPFSLLKLALFCLWPFPFYHLQHQYAFYSQSDYFSPCQLTLTSPVILPSIFDVIFSFSPLISCAHLKSLLTTRLSVSLSVTDAHKHTRTHTHTHTLGRITYPHHYFKVIILCDCHEIKPNFWCYSQSAFFLE